MIVIEKAILHILDFTSGVTVYSDQPMELEDSVQTFLQKHLEKMLARTDAKTGKFYDDSAFQKAYQGYLAGATDFVSFTKDIAKKLENAYLHTDEPVSTDIICLDLRVDDRRQFVLLKCTNHTGYVHQVNQTEQGVENDIIHHYAILPGSGQRIDEFVVIDAETLELHLVAKKYSVDGDSCLVLPELLLECSLAPSQKDALKSLQDTTAKVAESYGQDGVTAAAAAKNYVAEHMEISDELDLKKAGEEIFAGQPAMQADYNRQIEEQGFEAPVQMDQEQTLKKVAKHKLKTDTGIELTIPTDYFDNTQYLEFNNCEDGTISITIKHVASIVNRG